MNWVTKNINEFLMDSLQSAFDFVGSSLIKMFNLGTQIAVTREVTNVVKVTTIIGIGLVTVFLLKEVLNIYILETDGDPEADPFQLLVRGAQAIALITCQGWVFHFLSKMSSALIEDVIGSVKIEKFRSTFDAALGSVRNVANPSTLILFLIFSLGIVIFLCFKAALRGGELALCKILLPIFAIDLVGTSRERFNNFITTYLVTFFGYSIQLFCFEMGLSNFIRTLTGSLFTTFDNYIMAIVWMWLAVKTPKWLEKFVYSSGVKQAAGGAGRSATSLMMVFGRRM